MAGQTGLPMIYHIATGEEWDGQAGVANYAPSAYAKEQFIHCCDLHQLEAVASKYFAGSSELVVLEIMPTGLEPETKYERSGVERFPHVYGPINKSAINRVIRVRSNVDGLFDGAFSEV